MSLTRNDLKKHVWLCAARAVSKRTLELEHDGFNYFFRSKRGSPVAYALVMLR